MKILVLIFTIFLISGCGEPEPCKPVPCKKQECKYPKLPTYKAPDKKKFPKPVDLGNSYEVDKAALHDVFQTNVKLRNIIWKYTKVNVTINREYGK